MERSQIEGHFNNGNFKQALAGLEGSAASQWRDTTKLRCLRAMGHKDAIHFANELKLNIEQGSSPYSLNTSKRNNQLRYIALVLAEHGPSKESCKIMHNLCKSSPEVAALHREYAFALTSNSQFEEAELELNKAIDLQPQHAKSHAQLARIYCQTGRVEAGYTSFVRAATIDPKNLVYMQHLVYWGNYLDRTSQQNNYQLARLWANKAFPNNQASSNIWRAANPDRRLKIAFVSSDFCAHAVSFFIVPLLEGLDRNSFQVSAYSDTKKVDGVTDTIRELCDIWRDSTKQSDAQLAAQLTADQIDILVDLNGHSRGNRLGVFAKNVVPIQVSWLGYPSTTGLKSVMYRITDRIADPAGPSDQFFSEKLLRLPNGFLCYKPLSTAPTVAQRSSNDVIRFGSFNSLAKISSLTLDCWAAAMHAVPESTLYLKRQQLAHKNAKNYFVNEFAKRGINKDRLILKTSTAKIEKHLAEYSNIDIALDTVPYNGTTTTLEALWMGVPVISLRGQTHASRVSAGILQRLNLGNLATSSVLEFAQRAHELSQQRDKLKELRINLRSLMKESSLMDHKQFGAEFGNTLRSQWRDWCHQRNEENSIKLADSESVVGAAQ